MSGLHKSINLHRWSERVSVSSYHHKLIPTLTISTACTTGPVLYSSFLCPSTLDKCFVFILPKKAIKNNRHLLFFKNIKNIDKGLGAINCAKIKIKDNKITSSLIFWGNNSINLIFTCHVLFYTLFPHFYCLSTLDKCFVFILPKKGNKK